ncbi:hypothetical protein LJR225_003250 [Phenylobacterium sp. LjRoot225]|uniref:hypothetical protein n=1 Tax=Phenylobacterium sp. LjRoot225 TaxID=3342285 RepID=UPI003ECF0ADE
MTIALPPWLGALVAFLVCGAALWKGDLEERLAAAGFLTSLAVTVLLRDNSWPHIQRAIFIADTLLFALLLVIALRTPKFWPMAAAGFQLLAIMTHLAKVMDAGLQQWAYMTAGVIWTYLQLGAVAVGTWNAQRARAYSARTEDPARPVDTRR